MPTTEADPPLATAPAMAAGRSPGPPDRDDRPGASLGARVKRAAKALARAVGLAVAALPAASCRLESRLWRRDELFLLWGQAFAILPGTPGKYLRAGFYRLTLAACAPDCDLGFLCLFTDRRAEVGPRVYVGVGSILGLVSLGEGALIGSRVGIPSGRHQHRLGPDGRLTPFDPDAATRVRIGEETWIGEGSTVMADVGSRCIVAAGTVVSAPVPSGNLVGGNPARFVRRLVPAGPAPSDAE